MDPHLSDTHQKLQNSLQHLTHELAAIRAGRANPSLLEEVPIQAYGTRMKLMEVGTITAPQPTLLTVQVWDGTLVKDVEKAIMEANLGLNPSTEGNVVRVPIPPLTEERREEFAKLARTRGEECKIDIRRIRQDIRDVWKKEEESGTIGEDEFHRREKLLQELIDKMSTQVDAQVKTKEEELMQI